MFDESGSFDLLEKIKSKTDPQDPFLILFVGINGTGKTTRVAVFAQGDAAEAAKRVTGVSIEGGKDILLVDNGFKVGITGRRIELLEELKSENTNSYLINNFDYDKLFYENIEYFLQEYKAWEKINTTGGTPNAFDTENYLQFTPENIKTILENRLNDSNWLKKASEQSKSVSRPNSASELTNLVISIIEN